MKKLLWIGASAAVLALVGCGDKKAAEQETKAPQEVTIEANTEMEIKTEAGTKLAGGNALIARKANNKVQVAMALQHPDRPKDDLKNDEPRKAAAVLEFAGIAPGMSIVEMEAGSGYYTELLSRIVGEEGSVLMQNPQSFDAFVKPEVFAARLGEDGKRLANVTHSRTNFDVLDVPTGSADMVTWILGPHELWLKDKEGALTLGAPEKVYAEIARVLKPGGSLLLLDHKAAEGAPETTGGDTHRIDPNAVRRRAVAAGLVQVDASDALANSEDDYNTMVFDPKVRRKTDRFIHLYTKPKK